MIHEGDNGAGAVGLQGVKMVQMASAHVPWGFITAVRTDAGSPPNPCL